MSNKIFFYDLETTGVSYDCAIHQLSASIYDLEKESIVEDINLFASPHVGARIESEALEVCGITEDALYAYPRPETMYRKLTEILGRHVEKFNPDDKMFLGGYNNSKFDDEMFKKFFILNDDKYFNSFFYASPVVDVYHLASRPLLLRRKYMPNFKLATVASFMGIAVANDELHDARYDLQLTIELFRRINKTNEILSLEGLNIGELMNKLKVAREERKQKMKEPKNNDYHFYNG